MVRVARSGEAEFDHNICRMPKSTFAATLSMRELIPIWNSTGAHVAAKLQEFESDERTLTDELCDMFFIWSRLSSHLLDPKFVDRRWRRLSARQLRMVVTKTTQSLEAKTGNDFRITVTHPDGRQKRALFQCKVLDPVTNKLRCPSSKDWKRLSDQLVKMQQSKDVLAFLLVYVPMKHLDGSFQGFPTWEQWLAKSDRAGATSAFGTIAIAAASVVDQNGSWKHPKKVEHLGSAQFTPNGVSLSSLLVKMLRCDIGAWSHPTDELLTNGSIGRQPPRHELSVSFLETDRESWEDAVASLRELDDTSLR